MTALPYKLLYILILGFIYFPLFSQIGIGTQTPNPSAKLDIQSTDKGVLIPRMTTAERNTISLPAEGLIIFNTDKVCLEINSGLSNNPRWHCVGETGNVVTDCNLNGFSGAYINGVSLDASHTFSVTLTNNTFTDANISFSTSDLIINGVSGINVNAVSPTNVVLASGASQLVEYTLSGTPTSTGTLSGIWTKIGLNCTTSTSVVNGDATFTLPPITNILSIHDGTPLVDIQGIIDNTGNQITLDIPYTGGVGTYDAYTGTFVNNNSNTGEGGDLNGFRLSYPGGSFGASGTITATIEVDGDGSFNVKKQLFENQETLVSLIFMVNGINKGNIEIDALGGIPDKNYADPNHQFIYMPITALDGNVWLNNNLGADYSNFNHPEFNPTQQATIVDDYHAFGSIYQWGRTSDGHELVTWTGHSSGSRTFPTTTAVKATTDTPLSNDFITDTAAPFDWRSPQNDNLWQGASGINNPCPNGYRIPTNTEFANLVSMESITNSVTALNSTPKFPRAGYIGSNNGIPIASGLIGYYWTSSINGTNVVAQRFDNGAAFQNVGRALGFGVRCIKD